MNKEKNKNTKLMVIKEKKKRINILGNILSPVAIILTLFIAGLFVIQHLFFYDWGIQDLKEIAIIEIAFTGFNWLYLGILKKKKSFDTYLIFLAIAKTVVLMLAILGSDLSKIIDNKTKINDNGLDSISMLMSYIGDIGITFTSVIIFPYMLMSYLLNWTDYKVILKCTNGFSRNIWFFFLVIFEIAMFYAIIYFINKFLNNLAEDIWEKVVAQEKNVSSTIYGMVTKVIYTMMRPVLLVGWLPALITLNKIRGGHVFNDKGPQIYIALKISLLISYVNMYYKYNIDANIDVLFTMIMISIISFSLLVQFVFLFVAMWRNAFMLDGNIYIPHMIKIRPKINKTVKQLRENKDSKLFNLFYER